MISDLLVGVDLGTTMTKVAVVRADDGQEVAWGRSPTPWTTVPSGAETSPERLLEATLHALVEALSAAPEGRVAGVGVTSMAETVVVVGADGQPVAPCMAWYDGRGNDEAQQLEETFGAGAFSARTGLSVSPMCSLVKLAWLSHEGGPRPVRAFSIADWLAYMLGGEQAAEASLSSRTGALSLEGRSWWAEGLEWAGASASLFAGVAQAGDHLGSVSGGTFERLGVSPGGSVLGRLSEAAVTSAGHDHLCAAAGAGALEHDQVFDSCGTAEAFVRSVPPLDSDGAARAVSAGLETGWHTLPGSYALVKGQSLGLMLERVLSLLGISGAEGLATLDRAASGVGPGSLEVAQASPFGPPSIINLDARCSPAALWRAALVHASDGALSLVRAIQAVAGPARELVISGGWSHCPGLRRGKLNLLPSARWPQVVEAGARGAALFGGRAAGIYAAPTDFPVPVDQPWYLSPAGAGGGTRAVPPESG